MKIANVEPVLLSAPYRSDRVRTHCLILVHSDIGTSGLGETLAGAFQPEAAAALVEDLSDAAAGLDPTDPRKVRDHLFNRVRWWGTEGFAQAVIGGIEAALWDLMGNAERQPVWKLLGGSAQPNASVPIYASGGLNTTPVNELVVEMRGYCEAGFRTIKMRAAYTCDQRSFNTNIERISAVREAIGSDIALAVDAGQGFYERPWPLEFAIRQLQALERFRLLFFEEPLTNLAPESWAALRKQVNIPLAGGESTTMTHGFARWLNLGALDYVQPDVTWCGGPSEFQRIVDLAAQSNVSVVPHSWLSAVGMAMNLHAAVTRQSVISCEFPVLYDPLQFDLWIRPPRVIDGRWIAEEDVPGFGVRLTDRARSRYRYIKAPYDPIGGYGGGFHQHLLPDSEQQRLDSLRTSRSDKPPPLGRSSPNH